MNTRRSWRPTATDVARVAKVSTATVSYVLNDVAGQRISAQTREAVLSAAEQLRYRPNLAARNLRVGRSGVVLYVLPRMALPEVPVVVASRLTGELARHGIVLSLQLETDDGQNIVDAISHLHPVAVTSIFPLAGAALEATVSAGVPQIFLGSDNLQALDSLNDAVGGIWVDHLTSRGHQRIAFAYSEREILRPLGDYWLAGLRTAANCHGLPDIATATVVTDGANVAGTATAWVNAGITAVCTHTDETALVLLTGMREIGLRCPEDLAVISADAGPLGDVCRPALSSVAFDPEAIADAAASAILANLGHRLTPPLEPLVLARLLERKST